ncbi:hypothetical protein [Klebsiella variicola]|uniref:hypothetical protein n=2 Tax=Klebsiella/Raoultella group TaxID=2890311 RepID=UPI0015F2D775|nr:hypothetical protein [Klebsiella variicola]
MKPSKEIAAIEQNAQAKIQFWNAVRKMIPGTGTITNGTASRSLLLKGKKEETRAPSRLFMLLYTVHPLNDWCQSGVTERYGDNQCNAINYLLTTLSVVTLIMDNILNG